MKTLTRYHRASGSIVGRRMVPDDYAQDDSTPEIGIYQGEADPATQYVVDGALEARTVPAGLSVSKRLIAADGADTATITGLPADAWLRINGAFVQASGTTHAITATEEGAITVQLAGAHMAPELVIRAGDAVDLAFDADPRWQALQSATPAQIDAWLSSNVTTLAQARAVLRLLLLAVRRIYRLEGQP